MSNRSGSINMLYHAEYTIDDISRRNAMKHMGMIGSAAMMAGIPSVSKAETVSDKPVKVVIVGGGTGGIMVLSKLKKTLPNAKFTLIAPNKIHLYQPGEFYVAAGIYEHKDIKHFNKDFVPEDVEWIRDEVASFHPDDNKVTTREGMEIGYDYMVVATGMVCHYDKIIGLTEEDIGKNGITSVYLSDLEKGTTPGAEFTWKWFNDLRESAKTGSKPTVLYTHPDTPVKGGNVSQQILYLSADYLKQEGCSAHYIFLTSEEKLFNAKHISSALENIQKQYDTIVNKFSHTLVAMDVANKVATFKLSSREKDNMQIQMVDINYDFIHVVPPMAAPKAVVESKLSWQNGPVKGWLEVDMHTLQHKRYPNIFGIGDVCGIPDGKTGGSARYHAEIVAENLVAQINKAPLKEKFDGYTVCPIKTQYGKIIMAEFNYDGYAPTIPFLDPATPRWFWWEFDLYMLKPMYWHLMLRGRM